MQISIPLQTPPLNPLPEGEGTYVNEHVSKKGILPPSGEGPRMGVQKTLEIVQSVRMGQIYTPYPESYL